MFSIDLNLNNLHQFTYGLVSIHMQIALKQNDDYEVIRVGVAFAKPLLPKKVL